MSSAAAAKQIMVKEEKCGGKWCVCILPKLKHVVTNSPSPLSLPPPTPQSPRPFNPGLSLTFQALIVPK